VRKLIFTLCFVLTTYLLNAQVLYGTTLSGGDGNSGAICKLDVANNALTTAFSFEAQDGAHPQCLKLEKASDGKLYGMTYEGGRYGYGVIFSFDPSNLSYTKLKDFDIITGAFPNGSLIQASDGKLYGMTPYGGSNGYGVIFSFDPSTSMYAKLKDFDNTTGANPNGSLVQASDGKLYGMTSGGGSSNYGVIFSFDLFHSTYTKLKDFDNTIGGLPNGSLIQASDGKLYGVTSGGGNYGSGVIFSFDPFSSTYNKLKDLENKAAPYPNSSLMEASDGKLYGMTDYGGSFSFGFIFSFDPATSTYAKLKDFGIGMGGYPLGTLIQMPDGKLYGVTASGGSCGHGVIFSFDPSDSIYTTLKDFGSNNTGTSMHGSLIQASDGKFYGMTYNGGISNRGVIFSFDPFHSTYTKLKDFDNTNGSYPYGSLIQTSDGKLYGMTYQGGSSNQGVIFSFDPTTSTYAKLKDFDGTNGRYPYGSLLQAIDGKLYGMTSEGGSGNYGVIFSYDPATSTYTKLKDFNGINGRNPYGSFVQASDGKLYGMTSQGGGSSFGIIFSFDPSNSTYTKLKDFDNTNGGSPYGSLIQASNGKLYGTASGGGSSNYGVIFSYNLSNSTYTKLKDFDNTNGGSPYGSLIQASNGKLYGMTFGGGINGYGVSFSYDLSASTYTKLVDFDGSNGSNPQYTSFIEISCITTTYYQDADGDGFGNINNSVQLCEPQTGYVIDSTDCNDNDASVHAPVVYYQDADKDGYGDAINTITECSSTPPAGYVTNSTDCNDHNAALHPGAVEMCGNGVDDNCDGQVDEGCPVSNNPQIAIVDKSIIEGNKGSKMMYFIVQVNKKHPTKVITVDYHTEDGTAIAGNDYIAQSGTLTFEPGIKKLTLGIQVNGDKIVEGNEVFNVIVSNPLNAVITDAIGTGTIIDNDATAIAAPTATKLVAAGAGCTVHLTPNPVQNKVNIVVTGYAGNTVIQLSDINGRSLLQRKVQTSPTKFAQQQINVVHYANGVYFITVSDEKGNRQTKKLIIAR
jgi:uncharacterized repeat protein (TIGR03803 family)